MQQLNIPTFECLRCGHRWHPRNEELAKCCGFCKSAYWNVPADKESKVKERHEQKCTACKAIVA